MEKIELERIFQTYLKRLPINAEYSIHGSKSVESFTKEITTCSEYLKIKNGKDSKLKIALLISGHIRQNQIKESLSMLYPYNFDVFIHTWDNFGNKGTETNLNDTTNVESVISHIKTIPNVKKYKIENNSNYITNLEKVDFDYVNYSSPENFIISQLYSINQTYQLLEEYSNSEDIKYDVVIRCRFDCYFTKFELDIKTVKDINDNKIIFVSNTDCNHIHPDSNSTTCQVCETMYRRHGLKKVHNFPHSHVICDVFAFGSFKSMKDYCSLYHRYYELNKSFSVENKKIINDETYNIKCTHNDNVYLLDRGNSGHLNSLYYLNCSYPERLLQVHLSDYLLPSSTEIKVKMTR